MSFFKIRPMKEEDSNYIVSSTVKNYWKSSYFAKPITKDIFFTFHHVVLKNILARPSTKCLLAVDEKDPSLIFGFVIAEFYSSPLDPREIRVLHYIYTKNSFRNFGIARALLEASGLKLEDGFQYTHETIAFADKPFKNVVYNPYLI